MCHTGLWGNQTHRSVLCYSVNMRCSFLFYSLNPTEDVFSVRCVTVGSSFSWYHVNVGSEGASGGMLYILFWSISRRVSSVNNHILSSAPSFMFRRRAKTTAQKSVVFFFRTGFEGPALMNPTTPQQTSPVVFSLSVCCSSDALLCQCSVCI